MKRGIQSGRPRIGVVGTSKGSFGPGQGGTAFGVLLGLAGRRHADPSIQEGLGMLRLGRERNLPGRAKFDERRNRRGHYKRSERRVDRYEMFSTV